MVSGNEEGRARKFPHLSRRGFAFGNLKQVAGKRDAGDIVQRILVHGDAREFCVNQNFAKVRNGGVGGDRDDLGARRHEFQNALVAELNNLLDHLRFAGVENSLLLGGVHEGFDSLFLQRRTVGVLIVGDTRNGTCKIEKHAERPNDPQKRAYDESQADEPASFCPREQKVRNKLGEQKHFDEHVDQRLQQCVPRARDKHDHAARGLGRDQHQPQIREQAESRRGASPLQTKVGLDFRFEIARDARGLGLCARGPTPGRSGRGTRK